MAHDPLARRGFLRGLAAAPATLVAAGTLAPAQARPVAPAGTPEPMSAEVTELTRLFDAAVRRSAAAVDACSDAEERLVDPHVPEALFQRPDDPLHRYVRATPQCRGRFWYGDEEAIERLRVWPMDGSG